MAHNSRRGNRHGAENSYGAFFYLGGAFLLGAIFIKPIRYLLIFTLLIVGFLYWDYQHGEVSIKGDALSNYQVSNKRIHMMTNGGMNISYNISMDVQNTDAGTIREIDLTSTLYECPESELQKLGNPDLSVCNAMDDTTKNVDIETAAGMTAKIDTFIGFQNVAPKETNDYYVDTKISQIVVDKAHQEL